MGAPAIILSQARPARGTCRVVRLAIIGFVLGGSLAAGTTRADEPAAPSPWLYRQILVKPGAVPKVGRKTFPWTAVPIPAKVTKENGDWLWVGNVWIQSKDVLTADEAPGYFAQLLNTRPAEAPLWYQLRAVAWFLRRDYENAVQDCTQALGTLRDNASLYHLRGQARHKLAQYDRALADFSEAIRWDPDYAVAYSDRGAAYNDLGQYARAHEEFTHALRIEPRSALYYQNRGGNWYDQDKYDEALADFDRALELDPTLISAWCNRGHAWFKRGDYEQARRDFEQAIARGPDEPWGYYDLARMSAMCPFPDYRDGAKAVELATKACELSRWEEWLCVATLAAAQAEAGDFALAVKYQRQAIALDKWPEAKDRDEMQRRLAAYERGEPWRDEATSR